MFSMTGKIAYTLELDTLKISNVKTEAPTKIFV